MSGVGQTRRANGADQCEMVIGLENALSLCIKGSDYCPNDFTFKKYEKIENVPYNEIVAEDEVIDNAKLLNLEFSRIKNEVKAESDEKSSIADVKIEEEYVDDLLAATDEPNRTKHLNRKEGILRDQTNGSRPSSTVIRKGKKKRALTRPKTNVILNCNLKCYECSLAFTEEKGLACHVQLIHKNFEQFQCSECDQIFRRKMCLVKHIKSAHSNPKSIKLYRCPECENVFKKKSECNKHLLSTHGTNNMKFNNRFKAVDLLRPRLKLSLINELKLGQKVPSFQCNVCYLKFSQRDFLAKHVDAIHNNEHDFLFLNGKNNISTMVKPPVSLLSTNVRRIPPLSLNIWDSSHLSKHGQKISAPEHQIPLLSSPRLQIPLLSTPGQQIPPLSTLGQQIPPLSTFGHQIPPLSTPGQHIPPLSIPEQQIPPLSIPELQVQPLFTPEQQIRPLSIPELQIQPLSIPELQIQPLSTPGQQRSPLSTPGQQIPSLSTLGQQIPSLSTLGQQISSLSTIGQQILPVSTPGQQIPHLLSSVPQISPPSPKITPQISPFYNDVSQISLSTHDQHIRPLITSTPPTSFKSTDSQSFSNILKLYKCTVCDFIFRERVELYEHMLSKHEGWETFNCSECSATFSDEANLKTHILETHGMNEPIKYNQYLSSCSDTVDLTKQLEDINNKKKEFKCSECNSSFIKKIQLNKHAKIVHGKLKEFICSVCCITFSKKLQLNVHVKMTHDTWNEFQCSLCDSTFSKEVQLNYHIEKVNCKCELKKNECVV